MEGAEGRRGESRGDDHLVGHLWRCQNMDPLPGEADPGAIRITSHVCVLLNMEEMRNMYEAKQ